MTLSTRDSRNTMEMKNWVLAEFQKKKNVSLLFKIKSPYNKVFKCTYYVSYNQGSGLMAFA